MAKSLDGLGKNSEIHTASIAPQEPHKNQLQSIETLHINGQYKEVLTQALQLLEQFPNSFNLFNIIGAANKSLVI